MRFDLIDALRGDVAIPVIAFFDDLFVAIGDAIDAFIKIRVAKNLEPEVTRAILDFVARRFGGLPRKSGASDTPIDADE